MKINLEYMAKLCSVFIESKTAMIELCDFEKKGIVVGSSVLDDGFLFHIQLMLDCELISDTDGVTDGLTTIGVMLNGNGNYRPLKKKFRLTQKGHDFAKTLTNKEVLSKLTTDFKDAPFKSIYDIGQKLLEHYCKKKLDDILSI